MSDGICDVCDVCVMCNCISVMWLDVECRWILQHRWPGFRLR